MIGRAQFTAIILISSILVVLSAILFITGSSFFVVHRPSAGDWVEKGDAFHQASRPQDAINAYTNAIALKPDCVIAYFNRALLYSLVTREYGKAVDDYTRVIQLQPNNISAYSNRGRIYQTMLQYDKAINDYTRIIGIDANAKSLAYYGMASTYASMNDIKKACEYLNKAISEGYNTWIRIESDETLDNIRNAACYKELMSGR